MLLIRRKPIRMVIEALTRQQRGDGRDVVRCRLARHQGRNMSDRDVETTHLRQQWRPSGIRRKTRRRHLQFVAAGNVDRVEQWPAIAAGIAEEHQYPAVGGEGRTLIVIALSENAFARPVEIHYADSKSTLVLFG